MNNLLTPAAVADKFGVSVSTVQRWLRDGTLRGQKLGPRMWTIPAESLADFTPPARGSRPAPERRRLLDQAREMVAAHPGLLGFPAEMGGDPGDNFPHWAHELATQAGVNRDRARGALAKAIRLARARSVVR